MWERKHVPEAILHSRCCSFLQLLHLTDMANDIWHSVLDRLFLPLRQIPTLEVVSCESLTHDVSRCLTPHKSHAPCTWFDPSFLSFCFTSFFPMQRLFPEKLSRCQWLPAVSEAVVKRPCLRLPLATITTTVIIIMAVFNLVRLCSQFECKDKAIMYSTISSSATLHRCHARLQSMLSSGCLSVKLFFTTSQCFVQTHEKEDVANLFYLPVSNFLTANNDKCW